MNRDRHYTQLITKSIYRTLQIYKLTSSVINTSVHLIKNSKPSSQSQLLTSSKSQKVIKIVKRRISSREWLLNKPFMITAITVTCKITLIRFPLKEVIDNRCFHSKIRAHRIKALEKKRMFHLILSKILKRNLLIKEGR